MDKMNIKTERLFITTFDESMITSVHRNSLDEDTRRFIPDEVFETEEAARGTVEFLMQAYDSDEGPFVYPIIILEGNENIGYVQAIWREDESLEIGYKIAEKYRGNGYAVEALKAFIPMILDELEVDELWGITCADNTASCKVLEKLNFELQEKLITDYHGNKHEVCKYLYRM